MYCVSCDIFSAWQTGALSYAEEVTNMLSPLMLPIFSALFTLYWAGRIGFIVLGAEFHFPQFAKDMAISCIAGTLLTFPSIWQNLMLTFRDTSTQFATWLVNVGEGQASSGLNGLLAAIDMPIFELIRGSQSIVAGTSLYEISLFLSALILVAAYFALWLFIVTDIIWVFTKFIVITALGPVLFLFLMLPPTRGIATAAFRLILQAVLEFAVIGIIIGLASFILRQAINYMPLADGTMKENAADYVLTSDYLAAIFCALLLLFLRSGFRQVAAQLANAVADSAPLRQAMAAVSSPLNAARSALASVGRTAGNNLQGNRQ